MVEEIEEPQEYLHELKIPMERIAVLIGKSGDIKTDIEVATNSKINIDSREGDIEIRGEDSIGIMVAKDVITAVGRGFNPNTAMLLLKQDYVIEIINMKNYVGKSKKQSIRLKGRVIGAEGKTRTTIENLTETFISVYGKTISIIGNPERVAIARRAIEKILGGAEHSTVYSWLERKQKELRLGPLSVEELDLREPKNKE